MPRSALAIRGPESRILGRQNAVARNRASPMAEQIQRLLQRLARLEAREQIAAFLDSPFVGVSFEKAKATRSDIQAQLRRILERNGYSAFTSSTRRALGSQSAMVTAQAMDAFLSAKDIRVQQIMGTTRQAVKDSIRQILLTAMREDPRPSAGEIARRIRTLYHGDAGGRPEMDENGNIIDKPAPLINSRVLPTRRVSLDQGGNLYVFSPERAALIARTEMVQAENAGLVEGYTQAGADGLKWLAYRDGRTGDRRHDKMHGKVVKMGELFVLPSGVRIPYPGYYGAPISETANCRCTTAPFIRA